MKKWREKTGFALLALGIAIFANGALGADSCNPCNWDFCNMHFEVGGDYLYWKPCVDNMEYAAEIKNNGSTRQSVDYKALCPDWESGYRVYLKLDDVYCNLDLSTSYTYLNSENSSHTRFRETPTDIEGITSPLFHPDLLTTDVLFRRAHANWDMKYNAWDLLASYVFCCSECQNVRPYVGVAGIIFDQRLKVKFSENPDSPSDWKINWKGDYWGVGLKAGTEYSFRFCDCLSFFAFANGTLLAGEADTNNKQRFTSRIKVEDDTCCLFVPGCHLGLGVVYDACICNYEFGLRLGYEFLEWYNLPNPRIFSGDSDEIVEFSHSTSSVKRTVGFHGLFAGLSFRF